MRNISQMVGKRSRTTCVDCERQEATRVLEGNSWPWDWRKKSIRGPIKFRWQGRILLNRIIPLVTVFLLVSQHHTTQVKLITRLEDESLTLPTILKPRSNHHITQDNEPKLRLRLPWRNLQPKSDLTKRMLDHQKNCSAPLGTFIYRNRFGLGSDLHVWGQALCNGMNLGLRLRTVGNWTWMDERECNQEYSPMKCYFESSELNCPLDEHNVRQNPGFDHLRNLSRPNGIVMDRCQPVYHGMDRSQVRIAAMEFLFLHLSSRVVKEAERQLNLVFSGLDQVPNDLITVHIRWGDKGREMKLVEIHEYVKAVQDILVERGSKGKEDATVSIYLATEDPNAVRQFQEAIPRTWTLYVDQAYTELLPHRVSEFNGSPKMSKAVRGRAGLITLGSLLVALEANDFVLTTASNWSRVMNELRKAILDPRCDNCTSMKDLRMVRNEW